jgi:hypothetical protein
MKKLILILSLIPSLSFAGESYLKQLSKMVTTHSLNTPAHIKKLNQDFTALKKNKDKADREEKSLNISLEMLGVFISASTDAYGNLNEDLIAQNGARCMFSSRCATDTACDPAKNSKFTETKDSSLSMNDARFWNNTSSFDKITTAAINAKHRQSILTGSQENQIAYELSILSNMASMQSNRCKRQVLLQVLFE